MLFPAETQRRRDKLCLRVRRMEQAVTRGKEQSTLLWGSLPSCVPIGNRHARRLPIAAQDAILPHNERREVTGQRREEHQKQGDRQARDSCAALERRASRERGGK